MAGMKTIIIGAVLVLGFVAACGGDDDETGGLRPADEVRAEDAAAGVTPGQIGQELDLGAGLFVTVGGFAIKPIDEAMGGDPAITAQVRTENRGDDPDTANPEAGIFCAGQPESGGHLVYSTWGLGETLPAGSFDEGDLYLLLPGQTGSGEPLPPCENPVLRFRPLRIAIDGEDLPSVEVPIPQAILDEYSTAFAAHQAGT